eukprot:COSAG02_NODE_348_length_24081_cov_19.231007_14_plen_96_part_00
MAGATAAVRHPATGLDTAITAPAKKIEAAKSSPMIKNKTIQKKSGMHAVSSGLHAPRRKGISLHQRKGPSLQRAFLQNQATHKTAGADQLCTSEP